jgi:hypothetical protein
MVTATLSRPPARRGLLLAAASIVLALAALLVAGPAEDHDGEPAPRDTAPLLSSRPAVVASVAHHPVVIRRIAAPVAPVATLRRAVVDVGDVTGAGPRHDAPDPHAQWYWRRGPPARVGADLS